MRIPRASWFLVLVATAACDVTTPVETTPAVPLAGTGFVQTRATPPATATLASAAPRVAGPIATPPAFVTPGTRATPARPATPPPPGTPGNSTPGPAPSAWYTAAPTGPFHNVTTPSPSPGASLAPGASPNPSPVTNRQPGPDLIFAEIERVEVSVGSRPGPERVRIRSQAALKAFYSDVLLEAVPVIDFNKEEVIAFYEDGTRSPCDPEPVLRLVDAGNSVIVQIMSSIGAFAPEDCEDLEELNPSYTMVVTGKIDRPVVNATEYTPTGPGVVPGF